MFNYSDPATWHAVVDEVAYWTMGSKSVLERMLGDPLFGLQVGGFLLLGTFLLYQGIQCCTFFLMWTLGGAGVVLVLLNAAALVARSGSSAPTALGPPVIIVGGWSPPDLSAPPPPSGSQRPAPHRPLRLPTRPGELYYDDDDEDGQGIR
jgi:hypothetical protein